MLLRRVALENVRSFLDRAELSLDGNISILIGPNGGGKTNLLDAIVIMIRRHLFASMYAVSVPTPEEPNRHEFRYNDALEQLILEKHSAAADRPQLLEVEVEVTARDLDSMATIKRDSEQIMELAAKKYVNLRHREAAEWNVEAIAAGRRFTYRLVDGSLEHGAPGQESTQFLQFLQVAEIDSQLREEYDLAALSTPIVYLPVNRTANAMSSSIELAGYNAFEQKRQSDATISRTQFSLVQVAIGRLAQRYRLLLEKDNQRQQLDGFIQAKAAEQIFLPCRGSLEAYLPAGHAGKDIDKLIRFVSDEKFWEALDDGARSELEAILRQVSRAI